MATGNFGDILGHFRLTAASVVRWCLIYGQLIFLSDAIPADKYVGVLAKVHKRLSWQLIHT